MTDWYVLFVRSQSEEKIAKIINDKIDGSQTKAFLPKTAKPYSYKNNDSEASGAKPKRVWKKENKLCFPGYVFISSKKSTSEFAEEIVPFVNKIDGAYFFLNYGDDKHQIKVDESEQQFLNHMMDENHCIGSSKAIREGDKVKIIEGPLVGMESKIKKVNSNKRKAVLELEFMGELREVAVMLEVVKKEVENRCVEKMKKCYDISYFKNCIHKLFSLEEIVSSCSDIGLSMVKKSEQQWGHRGRWWVRVALFFRGVGVFGWSILV